ncbi:hypothetical protein QQP08_020171 [Theobroma cacao]|nr:hypothetical protein QQP08_020171 [Theobroma cacao]
MANGEKQVEDDEVDDGKEKGEGDVRVGKERSDDMALEDDKEIGVGDLSYRMKKSKIREMNMIQIQIGA